MDEGTGKVKGGGGKWKEREEDSRSGFEVGVRMGG